MNETLQKLLNKFVVIEYTNGDGTAHRTIAILRNVDTDLLSFETPAKHTVFIVNLSKVVEISELPPDKIRPEFMYYA